MSPQNNCEFRVDFSYNGTDYHSRYEGFSLAPVTDNYRLSLARYVGGNTPRDDLYAEIVGDATVHQQQFSTYDADHDNSPGNCAARRGGAGWWWNGCSWTNPNGLWRGPANWRGMYWNSVTTGDYSVTWTELKVRVPQGELDTRPISDSG